MADGTLYRDAIIITTVEKVGKGEDVQYRLALPFQIYGQDVVRNGQLITYSLDQHEGAEVMAKVDYKVEDEASVKAFKGYLPEPKKTAKYAELYPVTLADAKATYDGDIKIPYKGSDKNDKADFCVALSLKEK